MSKILIIDDEPAIRRSLRDILEFERYIVDEARDGLEGVSKIKTVEYDLVLCDIKLPHLDGMEVLDRAVLIAPDTPVIMISGHADVDVAVEAVRKGAFDFISKPLDLNRLLITIRNAMDKSSLIIETKALKRTIKEYRTQEMIGSSPALGKIRETIDRVGPTEARVLVTGPNGVGKELVARWIHEKSNRSEKPLVEVNCAAIPSELIESELFGHEKGSFTTALKLRIGKFEQADGGTLFLDEIGDMSLSAQAKVLRALQENRITRVGGEKDIKVDVRVIAATNKDLRKEIAERRFREDLFHRLAVIIIQVPSLDERKEDIPELAEFFVHNICTEYGIQPKRMQPRALARLQQLSWTGNIREMRNVIERLIILSNDEITEQDVLNYVTPTAANKNALHDTFADFQTWEEAQSFFKAEWDKLNQDR